MHEVSVTASELREKGAKLLDNIDTGRVLIRKHGKDRAYLIAARELRALEETLAVLENQGLMKSVRRGVEDIQSGRVQDAADVFAELDAEFRDEE